MTRSASGALTALHDPYLSIAIIGHGLQEHEAIEICHELTERGIPYLCHQYGISSQPIAPSVLVAATIGLLRGMRHAGSPGPLVYASIGSSSLPALLIMFQFFYRVSSTPGATENPPDAVGRPPRQQLCCASIGPLGI